MWFGLDLKGGTLDPKTPHPKPQTANPKPQSLNPKPWAQVTWEGDLKKVLDLNQQEIFLDTG